ncbi:MAG TPA: DUF6494 family protein [Zeimonas sp.]|nr:DUF6494 family protein [Zeimonas sp.]
MEDEALQQSIRKFLRTVGVRSQQEIEKAVAQARAAGGVGANDAFPATMTLDVPGLKLQITFDGEIRLG